MDAIGINRTHSNSIPLNKKPNNFFKKTIKMSQQPQPSHNEKKKNYDLEHMPNFIKDAPWYMKDAGSRRAEGEGDGGAEEGRGRGEE